MPDEYPDYDHDLDPWAVIALFGILRYVSPVQLFLMIGGSDTVFTREDMPVWDTESLQTLIRLKLMKRTMLALVFINPFTAEAGTYEVTVGDCSGTVELLEP